MTLVIADRVSETTTTTGTGTINLAGAAVGFQTFVSGVGNGNTTYYCITSGANWEVGIGTVTSGSPNTLSRTTILASSNSGAAITLAGTSTVFGDAPAALMNGTTKTASASAALSWTGLSVGIYSLFINNLVMTGTCNLLLQFGTGSTPTWDSGGHQNYCNINSQTGTGSVSATTNFNQASLTLNTTTLGTTANYNGQITLNLYSGRGTGQAVYEGSDGNTHGITIAIDNYAVPATITAVQIFPDASRTITTGSATLKPLGC